MDIKYSGQLSNVGNMNNLSYSLNCRKNGYKNKRYRWECWAGNIPSDAEINHHLVQQRIYIFLSW